MAAFNRLDQWVKIGVQTINEPEHLRRISTFVTPNDMYELMMLQAKWFEQNGGDLITYFSQDVLHGNPEAPSQSSEDGSDEDSNTAEDVHCQGEEGV